MATPEITEVRLIQKNSESLRTTVPYGVKIALDLKPSDRLEWTIVPEGDVITVRMRKLRPAWTLEELQKILNKHNST